jgi:hypothetical protein
VRVLNFLKFPVGQVGSGTVVEVALSGVESDVYLVDAPNFAAMQSGRSFRYHGGHFKASPVRLGVPHHGNWTAVVVPVGGRVDASVRILHGAGV